MRRRPQWQALSQCASPETLTGLSARVVTDGNHVQFAVIGWPHVYWAVTVDATMDVVRHATRSAHRGCTARRRPPKRAARRRRGRAGPGPPPRPPRTRSLAAPPAALPLVRCADHRHVGVSLFTVLSHTRAVPGGVSAGRLGEAGQDITVRKSQVSAGNGSSMHLRLGVGRAATC